MTPTAQRVFDIHQHVGLLSVSDRVAGGEAPLDIDRDNQVMAHNMVPALAKALWDLGHRTAAMLTSHDAYGDGNRKTFREAWQKLGGKIVADELFPFGATDFSAQLTKIRSAAPQVALVVAIGQTQGLIVKQARAMVVS